MEKQNIQELLERKNKFQHELNGVLSQYMSGDELAEVQQLISAYYAKKLTTAVDKLATENNWSQDTYEGWLKEHNRTAYPKL